MDVTSYARFILALILVLGLIFALTWVLKRLGLGQNQVGALGRRKRLRVVETASLDSRHRLVLVRRDEVEHLVVLSPTSAQLVESAIPAPTDADATELPVLSNPFKAFLGSATKDKTP